MSAAIDPAAATRAANAAAAPRVFFALWPDAAARDRIAAAARDVVQRGGGRVPPPEDHHLTLAFVGEVASSRLPALLRIGEFAAHAAAPFTLALDRLGEFHHTGIAWLGIDVAPVELVQLVRVLREALAEGAFRVEQRRFRAHLTIVRRCGTFPAATIAPVEWRVEFITLTASELRPAGSLYRELARWPLGASR
jgi:RNA 2',3'-cyclic 3'-phosphodiesterase